MRLIGDPPPSPYPKHGPRTVNLIGVMMAIRDDEEAASSRKGSEPLFLRFR